MSPVSAALPLPETRPTACFAVHARAEPGVMPRVLELFSKRGLVPSSWHSSVGGAAEDELTIDVQVKGMEGDLTDYVAACLRQLPYVEVVLTSEKRSPAR
jgi:acetolactate synthase small subunit